MDDSISRQAAIKHLKKRLYETALNNITEHPYYEEMADNRVDVWMNELPSAQPERKKGHYIGEADGYADGELVYDIWSCSECGCYFEDWDEQPTYNFCPNCGADMRGEQNG